MARLYHGGARNLRRGDVITPNMAATRYVDGCAECEAQKHGAHVHGFDPPTPDNWVYATTDIPYARYYASRAVRGWLYEVTLADDAEPSTEDAFPTWRASSATVVRIAERAVTLTMRERERLFVRWGGTREEFRAMVSDVYARQRNGVG